MSEWIEYKTEKPTVEGLYVWKCNHAYVKGLNIEFVDEFRRRGAGFETILSPAFDHWDGYRVLVPRELLWRHLKDDEKHLKRHGVTSGFGLSLNKCPFCNEAPTLNCGGGFIGASPKNSEFFYLECCRWINGFDIRFKDPRSLIKSWNKSLDKEAS